MMVSLNGVAGHLWCALCVLLQHHEKNISEKNRIMAELKFSMKQREGHNAALDSDLTELNVAVNERRHIDEVNGGCFLPPV